MTSAQHLVRALKAPLDPPVADGPLKITIAEHAWHDESFYLPNKAEVIAEFILSKFFKERMEGTSLGSERYWKLLSEVISSNSAPWLRPILGRISIVPIVTASLNSWSQLGSLHYAAYCISILYPLGTQKSTTEVLLDAWGVFLRNFVDDVSAVKIGLVVTQVYSDSLSNSASRKKASTNFIQNADLLNAWLERLTSSSNCPQYEYLRQSILSSGVETIFNLETLRPMFESPESAPLFLALSSTPRHTVIRALPLVFEHYVSSLKKHRGIIPSELNVIAMRFYDACTSLVRERDTEAWNTISALTGLVAKECLYGQGSSLGQNVAFALTGELTTATVRCLSATIRVDYDLVLPSMGKLLSRLLAIPQVHSDHFAFLDLLLEYHIKTRTVNTYIETLLSCLSPDSTVSLLPAQERYVIAHSSPVLHPQHLQKLGKAAQQFLTPSQCNGTVELVCETIKLLRERHKTAEKQWDAESGKGSRKKRKSDEMTVDRADSDQLALAFSLTSEVGRTVLSSLPMSSIPQRQAEQVRTTVALFREELVEHNLPKLLKRFMKSEDHEQENSEAKRKAPSGVLLWGTQVVIVSLLRLRYSVGLAGALSLPPIAESKLFRRLLLAISQDEDSLLPELALEIFRALFGQALVIDKSEASQLIDNALQFVEKRVSPSANIAWSGFPHELTFGEPGRFRAGLAALHLLLERWLPAINIVASQEQQRLLARLISRMSLSSGPLSKRGTELLVADHLLFRTLRSAQFWELRNIRSALLSTLVSSTSSLDSLPSEPSPSKKSPKLKQAQVDQFKVADVVSTYKLLLFFPIEYIAQSCRAELVKRAINADWRLSKRLEGGEEDEELLVGLSVVRTFLKRTFDFLGAVEQRTLCDVPNFILHLLEDASSTKGQSCHVQITLDLCEVYFLELLRHATRGGWAEAREVLNSYLQSPMFDDLESVRARSLVCLVELLRREFTFVGFSSQMRSVFQDVHARLTKDLEEKLDGVLEGPGSVSLVDTPDLLTSWHALLGLGQWIGLENCTFFGARLLKKLNVRFLSTQNNRAWTDRTSVITMAILLRELHFQGEVGRDALDIIVAGYLSCRKLVSSSGKVELDDFLAKACREFTPVNFEYVLGLLDEALVAAPSMAADLVHLALVLLGNHPHSTLRIMQGFFTRSVDIFTNDGTFITGPLDLRFQTLDFLVEHASERPAALRSLDLGRIWSLLSKYLSPSTVHDEATSAPIFHKIVTVLSAVMRLRRDLVTPMLPHLGMILRQLILCLRKCRPQLAPKQTEMVMSTQPQWITASQSLGIEEAKVLSRVLETLTTKTITRVHVTPTKTQKAESLATPFSKHAAFVLKAYIEAMNDALCVLTLDIRMELHPGLYALCGIIGEHSRDAMMVSALDASGKATLKALWREYEKQRYVGRG